MNFTISIANQGILKDNALNDIESRLYDYHYINTLNPNDTGANFNVASDKSFITFNVPDEILKENRSKDISNIELETNQQNRTPDPNNERTGMHFVDLKPFFKKRTYKTHKRKRYLSKYDSSEIVDGWYERIRLTLRTHRQFNPYKPAEPTGKHIYRTVNSNSPASSWIVLLPNDITFNKVTSQQDNSQHMEQAKANAEQNSTTNEHNSAADYDTEDNIISQKLGIPLSTISNNTSDYMFYSSVLGITDKIPNMHIGNLNFLQAAKGFKNHTLTSQQIGMIKHHLANNPHIYFDSNTDLATNLKTLFEVPSTLNKKFPKPPINYLYSHEMPLQDYRKSIQETFKNQERKNRIQHRHLPSSLKRYLRNRGINISPEQFSLPNNEDTSDDGQDNMVDTANGEEDITHLAEEIKLKQHPKMLPKNVKNFNKNHGTNISQNMFNNSDSPFNDLPPER